MRKFIFQNIRVALVFFTLHFLIGCVELYRSFNADSLFSALFNSGLFALIVTIVMIIYQLFYMRKNKIAINEFDITPNQSATFKVKKSLNDSIDLIENRLPAVLNSNKFILYKEKGFYKTKTKITFKSWGEYVIIKLTRIHDTETQLSILSKSILKTTLIDFGKGSMNIHAIKTFFEKNSK